MLVKRIFKYSKFSFEYKEPLLEKVVYFIWNILYFYSKNYSLIRPIFKIFNIVISVQNKEFKNYYIISQNENFSKMGEREKFYNELIVNGEKSIELLHKGYVDLEISFENIADRFVEIVRRLPCYNSQVPIQGLNKIQKLEYKNNSHNYFSIKPDSEELIPFYNEILSNKKLKELVNNYFGGKSYCYSINTMRSFPAINGVSHDVTKIHRDFDDIGFIAIFIYWTDISKTNGTTKIIPGSHRTDTKKDEKNLVCLSGIKGSVWALDPYTLHSGSAPSNGERIATWIRFSRKETNLAHYQDKGKFFDKIYRDLWSTE